jgi:hypothetical protein
MRYTVALGALRRMRAFVLAVSLLVVPALASAAVFVSVNFAPPAIPVYVQPIAPGPDFIWIPGYWAYGPDGYYWVPGTWVLAPYIGALWTPGYWAWSGGLYLWHAGYWGPHIGYYGGINYGFGYFGVGYVGGYWNGGHFFYNTAVTRVDVTRIHNTYNRTVVQNDVRVSYNGGPGGVQRTATSEERLAERDAHRGASPNQLQHERLASTRHEQLASVNHGVPAMTATPRVSAYNRALSPDGRVDQGPQGPKDRQAHAETLRAERSNAPMGHPQGRVNEAPHVGGPPPEHMGGPQGGPHERQGGGEHHEGRPEHEGHPGR